MAVEDSVAQDQLKAFISRIERMEEEKAAIAADIKEIYAEAKGNGFDTKILRKIVTIRKQDANERMEQEALLELYMDALGMQQAHDAAVNDRFQRGIGGRSAPLAADRVESISEPITEQQVAPQPASDLTEPSSSLSGQIAPIQPGTAAMPHSTEPALEQVLSGSQTDLINPSSGIGETGVRGAGGAENSETGKPVEAPASAAPLYTAPGVVPTEHTPPEPVKWHPYAQCFPTVLGDDLKALESDIRTAFGGVRDPIVKIGNLILDGRARYGIARSMMIDYPVVQYAGSDPLIDVIAWNLASRQDRMTSGQIAATAKALCRLEPHRADDIMQAFGLETVEAAQ